MIDASLPPYSGDAQAAADALVLAGGCIERQLVL
jgi:hypothetical protein